MRRVNVLVYALCLLGALVDDANGLQSFDNPSFRGQIVDVDQHPVVGADVWIESNPLDSAPREFLHASTDNNGKFVFDLAGKWQQALGENGTVNFNEDYLAVVWIHHEGHVLVDRFFPSSNVTDQNPFLTKLDFSQGTGAFRIVDASGSAIDGAIATPVFIRPHPDMPSGLTDRLTRMSRADGVVSYPLTTFLSVGMLCVESRSGGVQLVPVKNIEMKDELEIQLGEVGSLEGEVVDSDGKPVAGVEFKVETSSTPGGAVGMAEVVSASDGTFQVFNLASGQAFVRPSRQGENSYWFRKIDDVFVSPERSAKIRIVCETQRIRVEGQVTDIESGEPIENVRMKISYGTPITVEYLASDSEGRFVADVPEGVVLVEFVEYPDGFIYAGDQESIGFRTSFSEPVRELDIRLTREAVVRGRLIDREGRAVSESIIYAVAGDREYGRTETASDGSFTIRIPQGTVVDRYDVWLEKTVQMKAEIQSEEPLVLRLIDID